MNIVTVLLGAFLAGSVSPLAKRVVVGLGLGIISFAGLTTLLNQLISQAQTSYNGLPQMALGLAGLMGLGEALGMITGAMVVRLTLVTMKKFGVVV